jgi:hypothetical protein
MTTDDIMALADTYAGWRTAGDWQPFRDILKDAIEALQADARRYRWLRLRYDGERLIDMETVPDSYWGPKIAVGLDAEIDAAMDKP